jgi:octaprenyl-diphosphate synthase
MTQSALEMRAEATRLSPKTPLPLPTDVSAAFALVADEMHEVELALHRLLASRVEIIPTIGGHLTFAGGKRLRPLITLLAARACGLVDPARITIAAAGELLHTATLLHDDVVDAGDFRRGRPAARIVHGNGLAVLAGDYCLARALQAVATTGRLEAIRSFSDAVVAMAEGEVAQLDAAGDAHLDRQRYDQVIDRKTACLIAWCAAVGDLLASDQARALHQFGRSVGYAFQIADDVIDVAQDVHESGKARGQDLREGKLTLPIILACEESEALRRRVHALLSRRAPLVHGDVHLHPVSTTTNRDTSGESRDVAEALEILDEVVRCGAAERASRIAEHHVGVAIECLAALPRSLARDALETLATRCARRTT